MKIKIVFNITREQRDAIADFYGADAPASHEICAAFLKCHALADLEAVEGEHERRPR